MSTNLTSLFVIIVFLTVGTVRIVAQQTSAQINGRIFDSQGASLSGAEVTVTDIGTLRSLAERLQLHPAHIACR